jgi:hypothetical protein
MEAGAPTPSHVEVILQQAKPGILLENRAHGA